MYPDGDSYPPDVTDEATVENENMPPYPPPVQQPVTPSTSTYSTTTNFSPHQLRTCEKKTDLYILQPDRLNASGQANPLKGKLTNCHITGCER